MGKGGVGKTTVAASLAVLHAARDGRAVLIEFGDGESGKRALGAFAEGVEHVVIERAEAVQRAAAPLFGSASLSKMALSNFAMKPLLRAAPAIGELAMLEVVRQITAERPGVRVIVDMPATGHGVAWLRVPAQGRGFLGSGRMYDLCEQIERELLHRSRSSIVVVTLPERLVVEETLELCTQIAQQTNLDVDRVAVNRMPVPLHPTALRDARNYNGEHAAALLPIIEVLQAREEVHAASSAMKERLAPACKHVWSLPFSPMDPTAKEVAEWLRQAEAR